MKQFFSVPELAGYRGLLSLSQGLSLVYLNIDLYRQLFVFFDYSLHIQSRLNITRVEMIRLLLLFNLCLALLVHGLNYVLICASNKQAKGTDSIYNAPFFLPKIYAFAFLVTLTLTCMVCSYICTAYGLDRQVALALEQEELLLHLGSPVPAPDYGSLYLVRVQHASQACLLLLNWLYLSFYCCELLHVKRQLNLQPDHNYFMDRKQI